MDTIPMDEPWMKHLLPGGWPAQTATLITGPGGSGKPLIGNVVASSWLKEGGSVVFMSLQYPSHEFIEAGLRRVAGLELGDYEGRIAFLELDATMEDLETLTDNRIRANLVKPPVWNRALELAISSVPSGGPGVLIFGSALNLLLFSPTYGECLLEEMKKTMDRTDTLTHLFSVSSSAKKEMIQELEELADNLLVSHSSRDPFRLFLHVERMMGVPFNPEEIEVPISQEVLEEVKAVADHSRRRVIPLISKI